MRGLDSWVFEIPDELLSKIKARDRSRTDNLIITNDVLRQLSYAG